MERRSIPNVEIPVARAEPTAKPSMSEAVVMHQTRMSKNAKKYKIGLLLCHSHIEFRLRLRLSSG